MKAAVISPKHETGLSTITAMIGMTLTWTQQYTCMMSYLGPSDVPRYLGLGSLDDKTRSISQLNKLLQAGAIAPDQITEYSVPVFRDLWLMDTTSTLVTEEEKAKIISFVFDQVPVDVALCEVCDDDLSKETTVEILRNSDVIIIIFQPSTNQFDAVKKFLMAQPWAEFKDILYICNRYDDVIMPLRDISKNMGVAHTDMCKLHYNPWIPKMCEAGQLDDIVKFTVMKDPRVINLNNDLKEITSYFATGLRAKLKWEG